MPKHLTVDDTSDFVTSAQIGAASGVASLGSDGKIPSSELPSTIVEGVTSVNGLIGNVELDASTVGAVDQIFTDATYVAKTSRAAANGVASLDSGTLVPVAQVPPLPASQVSSGTFGTARIPDLSATYIATTQKAAASGVASLDGSTKVPTAQIPDLSSMYVAVTQKAAASGVASLDGSTKIPLSQIPDLTTLYIASASKNASGGVPGLDGASKLNGAQQLYSSTGTIVAIGSANAAGATNSAARGDHVHAGVTSVNGSQGVVSVTPANINAVPTSQLAVASGVATLDTDSKVLATQIRQFTVPSPASMQTISNSITETVVATLTIPANDATAGAVYHMRTLLRGSVTGTPSYTLRLYLGGIAGTLLSTMGPTVTSSNVANKGVIAEADFVCLTTGGSGTCTNAFWQNQTLTVVGSIGANQIIFPTATSTFNTTISNDLVITWQWSAASASNTVVRHANVGGRVG
jgi:hypothetical protein